MALFALAREGLIVHSYFDGALIFATLISLGRLIVPQPRWMPSTRPSAHGQVASACVHDNSALALVWGAQSYRQGSAGLLPVGAHHS